jgi:4a-hydroxytetrahydrobiopterin dehydratase
MKDPTLNDETLSARLTDLPGWHVVHGALDKTFSFGSFVDAIAFVNAVADAAETADHHPDIDIRYRDVTLRLVTHDSGGITQKDIDLASEADRRSVP